MQQICYKHGSGWLTWVTKQCITAEHCNKYVASFMHLLMCAPCKGVVGIHGWFNKQKRSKSCPRSRECFRLSNSRTKYQVTSISPVAVLTGFAKSHHASLAVSSPLYFKIKVEQTILNIFVSYNIPVLYGNIQ